MRVLAITQIWPNRLEPLAAAFNAQQFAELSRLCDLEVVGAVPYVPFAAYVGQPPRPAKLSALPKEDEIRGVRTHTMRQLYIPRFGVPVAVPLYAASLHAHRARIREADVLLGSWAYPDGSATTLIARALKKPCVVKVHGSDLNVIAERPAVRAIMRRVLPMATAVVSVSRALSQKLEALGVSPDKIVLVPNGVDRSVFCVRDRHEARRQLGVAAEGKLIVFVGRLEPQKGLHELLSAFELLCKGGERAELVLVGDGVARQIAEVAATKLPIRIVGARPLTEVAQWIAAADVFTLPSHNEGTPNVVLEALASGRPAVATRVGGIPDVLSDPRSGILVEAKNADDLARGLREALARTWDPEEVAKTGPVSWAESASRLHEVLERACATT